MTDTEYKEYIASLDEDSLRNLKKFARMIDEYGEKVLKELDENSEDNNKQ